MKKLLVATIGLFISLNGITQMSPEELGDFIRELDTEFTDYINLVNTTSSTSAELLERKDEFSEEEWQNEKMYAKEEIENKIATVKNYISEYQTRLSEVISKIEKSSPYIPISGKELLKYYKPVQTIISDLEMQFDTLSYRFLSFTDQYYGKGTFEKVFMDDQGKTSVVQFLTTFNWMSDSTVWKYKDILSTNEQLSEFYGQFEYEKDYQRQIKFYKKYKIDSLNGFQSEPVSVYIYRNQKTNKYGLLETVGFDVKNTKEILSSEYDSVAIDETYYDYTRIWTMAIGWKSGIATIKEKQGEDLGEYFGSEKILTYESPVNNIWFNDKMSFPMGAVAAKDTLGQFYYLNARENKELTVKYKEEEFLPLLFEGAINKDCYIRLVSDKIHYGSGWWRYENQAYKFKICYEDTLGIPTWYEDTARYIWFYKTGEIEKIRFKDSINGDTYKSFHPSGELKSNMKSIKSQNFIDKLHKNGDMNYRFNQPDEIKSGSHSKFMVIFSRRRNDIYIKQ
ncbi:hypothetical protein K6119_10960 [Paracrocinitomix mangrovi]|uniref:hypothetical protein n=1 Tax=Paracrocinitomix mangrovi TaxID=2862509 RepID=UPI001C8E50F7|nr:hypothetical protein [Paracrocinitomix mangrovi]UKN00253.1 hypothetical protein K6119_10960 [Paracrocinitomix mangrovi]